MIRIVFLCRMYTNSRIFRMMSVSRLCAFSIGIECGREFSKFVSTLWTVCVCVRVYATGSVAHTALFVHKEELYGNRFCTMDAPCDCNWNGTATCILHVCVWETEWCVQFLSAGMGSGAIKLNANHTEAINLPFYDRFMVSLSSRSTYIHNHNSPTAGAIWRVLGVLNSFRFRFMTQLPNNSTISKALIRWKWEIFVCSTTGPGYVPPLGLISVDVVATEILICLIISARKYYATQIGSRGPDVWCVCTMKHARNRTHTTLYIKFQWALMCELNWVADNRIKWYIRVYCLAFGIQYKRALARVCVWKLFPTLLSLKKLNTLSLCGAMFSFISEFRR